MAQSSHQKGSLVLVCEAGNDIAFRHRLFVKARDGAFVQWGETGHEYKSKDSYFLACGPDNAGQPAGIFGLSHKQLVQSAWLQNDTLTVKCAVEVRPNQRPNSQTCRLNSSVEVPGPTMEHDMRALWEKGACSDVQFAIQGDLLKAHTQVLCARSEVFAAQLTCGMQEASTKVIEITDCDLPAFKAFLQFLYTDSFAAVEELGLQLNADTDNSAKQSKLQALLAVSHKYQVKRLQRWCEMRLCEGLTTSAVCDILCQAHLHQATELEKACLSYIKDNMATVVKQPVFAEMVTTWPQLSLKVSLFAAGVLEAEAPETADALKDSQPPVKRKREEDE